MDCLRLGLAILNGWKPPSAGATTRVESTFQTPWMYKRIREKIKAEGWELETLQDYKIFCCVLASHECKHVCMFGSKEHMHWILLENVLDNVNYIIYVYVYVCE